MLVMKTENDIENLKMLREQIKSAFLESEHENEKRVSKIKKTMLNQTVDLILQAERQNDIMIKEMISSIPCSNELVNNAVDSAFDLDQLSADLASQLK